MRGGSNTNVVAVVQLKSVAICGPGHVTACDSLKYFEDPSRHAVGLIVTGLQRVSAPFDYAAVSDALMRQSVTLFSCHCCCCCCCGCCCGCCYWQRISAHLRRQSDKMLPRKTAATRVTLLQLIDHTCAGRRCNIRLKYKPTIRSSISRRRQETHQEMR